MLQHTAHTLGVSLTRTAHLGDSAADVVAARNAGVSTSAVPYGYNAGLPITHARPDRIFDSLAAGRNTSSAHANAGKDALELYRLMQIQ